MKLDLMQIEDGHIERLKTSGGVLEQVHAFDQESIDAINAALAAGRPLLVRGEPGTGKSQLACAAAKVLGRAYVSHVVDCRTESQHLLWHFDAVSRLAEAQLCAVADTNPDQARDRMDLMNYIHPRAFWWAFDWKDAACQVERVHQDPPVQLDRGDPDKGCVVLIDEIDKAETDVPNGLLETLGLGRFIPQGRTKPVEVVGPPPLVVITTNEERALPAAFVRRCLVLFLRLPEKEDDLIKLLCQRGLVHFPKASKTVLHSAAKMLVGDRSRAQHNHKPMPGQAEYLDLLRAVLRMEPRSVKRQKDVLNKIGRYVFRKNSGGPA